MCTARDVARGNRRQREEGEEEEEEEHDLIQPETNMAPPVLAQLADVEDDNMVTEAADATEVTQDDLRMGYLQISNDPSRLNASDEREEDGEVEEISVGNGLAPINNDALPQASNGQQQYPGSLAGAVVSEGRNRHERIVTVNGMQFHVYGNVSGLELLGDNSTREEDLDIPDSEEEEEEERRRVEMEKAVEEANAADAARRAAPIPPERRAMIVNAMKGINLGGFRPSWADTIPEDQWVTQVIKEGGTSDPK